MSVHVLHADNEWRFDPVDERWALVAHNRRTVSPFAVAPPATERALKEGVACPFCDELPPSPLTRLTDDRGHAAVAYPSPTPLCFVEHGPPPDVAYTRSGALGAHEVLVAAGSPHHAADLHDVDEDALALLFALALRRLDELSGDRRLLTARVAILPSGLSRLDHLHATLLATPHARVERDPCPVCADLDDARAHGRVLLDDDGVVAWTPFAPRGDLHVRVAVAVHRMVLSGEPAQLASVSLSRRVRAVARGLWRLAPGAALCASSGPLPLQTHDGHLWIDLDVPFEADALLGKSLGASVLTLAPEELARRLRAAMTPREIGQTAERV